MAEFNPVLVKELRGRMRGGRTFVLLSVYLGILSVVTALLYTAIAANTSTDLNAGRLVGQALFFVIAGVALTEVCIITPSLTAGGIAGEKERQTYDLLIASQLSPWQIVWGKLAAALAFALLMVLAVVPLMSLAFLFGGVSLSEVIIALIGLVTTAIFYACIGLFWSSVMHSTLGANSFALGSIILMLLGIPFIVVIFTLLAGIDARSWMLSSPFVYVGGALLSSHPFIALFLSDTFIRDGKGIFYHALDNGTGTQIVIPSPWLIYVAISMLCSSLLVLLSLRSIRATERVAAPRSISARHSSSSPAKRGDR